MDYLKLIAALFGATGFWKLLEIMIRWKSNKKKQTAEIINLQAQTEKNIVDNWIQWSQALEKRVKELEAVAEENKELKKQIESQRERIVELETKVERFEIENAQLRKQVTQIAKS